MVNSIRLNVQNVVKRNVTGIVIIMISRSKVTVHVKNVEKVHVFVNLRHHLLVVNVRETAIVTVRMVVQIVMAIKSRWIRLQGKYVKTAVLIRVNVLDLLLKMKI